MDDKWGLTEKGFNRPTYTVLLNALEYKAREMYGDGINLTVRSPLGIFLRILAWIWNILWSCLEDVYNSRFIDTAVGTSLYRLGRNIGQQLLPEGKATGYLTITGTPGTYVPTGYLVATNGGLQYTTMQPVTISEDGTATAIIRAAETGPEYNTPAGAVQTIVNPFAVAGIVSVTNKEGITGGRLKETDDEFRERYHKSVDYSGGVNADAIRAGILNDVEGVASALVYENDTDEEDKIYGLPPHSIEAVVYGGINEAIAKSIYSRKSGGIQTVGDTTIQVVTASGQMLPVSFSRPDPKKIYIKITNLKTNLEYAGDESIRQALIDYIGSDTSGGLGIGTAVTYIKLPGVLTALPGVEDFDLVIGASEGEYSHNNISVGVREKAVTDADAIIITPEAE